MAMAVVLFPVSEEPVLRQAALERLSTFGITSVTLLRAGATYGLVFEGWAFDAVDAEAAARAITGEAAEFTTLRPLVHMAVSAALTEGGLQ